MYPVMINRDDIFQAVMTIRGYILPMGVIVITIRGDTFSLVMAIMMSLQARNVPVMIIRDGQFRHHG